MRIMSVTSQDRTRAGPVIGEEVRKSQYPTEQRQLIRVSHACLPMNMALASLLFGSETLWDVHELEFSIVGGALS